MKVISNEYEDWLKAEIDIYQRYHNHKETMAWTATAFYLPGIIGLAYAASLVQWGLVGHVVFSVFALLISLAILFFVNMQFRMRWLAADITHGLRRTMARLCAHMPPLSEADIQVEEGKCWPRFVASEIESEIGKSEKLRTPKKYLGAFWHMIRFKWYTPDNRLVTEFASYLAITFVSLIAIFLLWR